MGTRSQEQRLIDEIVDHAREQLDGDHVDEFVRFLTRYYAAVPLDDLEARSTTDLYGAALAHFNLAHERAAREPGVRVYTPELEQHGWQSTHSVAELVNDDMPFLVDSVTMALTGRGLGIHLVVHPIVAVVRDGDGVLTHVGDPADGDDDATRESFIHVEFDRQSDPELLDEIAQALRGVLADVRAAVEDWRPMLGEVERIIAALDDTPPPVDDAERSEARAFLQWLHDDNFTLLGFRVYDLEGEGDATVLRSVPGSGLGILRQGEGESTSKSFAKLPREVRELARAPNLLNLTKANTRATVHRPAYLDYVGVKRFGDDGTVIGEWRFLGLYTSSAYHASPRSIPVLRRKVDLVVDDAGFAPGSHDHKDLLAIFDRYPRDELFQASADELYRIVTGIHDLQERRRVRLFARRDTYGRFVSCLVFLPRDRYDTRTRLRMQDILTEELDGTELDYSARVSESVLARLHFVIHTEQTSTRGLEVERIESRLSQATRTWSDELRTALVEEYGEEAGIERHRRYAEAFPPGYRGDTQARLAVRDIDRLESLDDDDALAMTLFRPQEAPADQRRFKLYHVGMPMTLSGVLPILENLGVRVIDQRPYEVADGADEPRWIYDFRIASPRLAELDRDDVIERFKDAFAAVWDDRVEDDTFNRLILAADLDWREVTVMRAYARYAQQIGTQFSLAYMAETLAANPAIAGGLRELFRVRFDPDLSAGRDDAVEEVRARLVKRLDALASLDEDRILRGFLHLVDATVRTNAFIRRDGRVPTHLSFKLDPAGIPDMPAPRPTSEIWVYAPRTEGVHLRSGPVARGGIRWSDRREDFRTEVLDLMKAQRVKNAVIVPMGAKGGFVVKAALPEDRDARQELARACYTTLMEGMLDVTDNIVDGEVAHPDRVVRYDGDDPYLVVAADKGTATFSDLANSIAQRYGYWLGDAYASGGSTGYDHKEMGITARGAWKSVERHFDELGIDLDSTDVTVVGIGDMSGDVFGNGMLLSRHLRIVAAFDHRHIFLDPDPDPETSFEERQRLFELPRSTWQDYDADVISPGGGVYARTTRSVPVSDEAAEALGIEPGPRAPTDLIQAILRAPVDLLFNGGVGTYVKASTETHGEVGDRANDPVRVDGADLRCRVVAEGGNLGLTQRGRIEFARRGGRINTDAIDNSAGVDASDHEVNIKILLDTIVADGDLTTKQRNELLGSMTDEVAELVLADNVAQNQALSSSRANADSMAQVHRRYLRHLETQGVLNRDVEALPHDEEMAERIERGEGLTRPELSVLLPYTKNWLARELLASDVPEDDWFDDALVEYFPTPVRDRYQDRIRRHRLRREIVVTRLTNRLVNDSGTTFVFRLLEETGAPIADIARAQTVARELFGLSDLRAGVRDLPATVPAETSTRLLLEGRRLVERASRWLLRSASRPLRIDRLVNRLAEPIESVLATYPDTLEGRAREVYQDDLGAYVDGGVPEDLARRVAGFDPWFASLDIALASEAAAEDPDVTTAAYFQLGHRLDLDWMRGRILALPRQSRWEALARDALRDELHVRQRTITERVLGATDADEPPSQRVAAWVHRHESAVVRCHDVVADIRDSGRDSVTTLTVALRELRNLVDTTE